MASASACSRASELLTKPSLIFLDEPTSGLDPAWTATSCSSCAALSDDGRTVLVVTHPVAELAICDKLLVMAPGGSVAYFGPPEEALNFFGYETWADVFSAFENYRDYDWAGRWKGLQHYQTYARPTSTPSPRSPMQVPPPAAVKPPKPQPWGAADHADPPLRVGDRLRQGLPLYGPDGDPARGCSGIVSRSSRPISAWRRQLAVPFSGDAGTIMLIVAVGYVLLGTRPTRSEN